MPAEAVTGTYNDAGGAEVPVVNARAVAGTYVLAVDTAALANGDTLEMKIKTKVQVGSTSALAYYATYANAQVEPVKYSIPVPVTNEVSVLVKGPAGKAFPWNLIAL